MLITSWICSSEGAPSMFSKDNFKFVIIWTQNSFPLCLIQFEMTASCLFLMQCSLKAKWSSTSSTDVQPCHLRTEISLDSPNLLIKYCRWEIQSLCNSILIICRRRFFFFLHIHECLSILTFDKLCLLDALFIPSHVTGLLPAVSFYHFTIKYVAHMLLRSISTWTYIFVF